MVQTVKSSTGMVKIRGTMLLSPKAEVRVSAAAAVMVFVAVIFLWLVYPSVCLARQKLHVVTSLFPLQEMARAVGGDRVSVDLLLPPGAEPHAWEPKPSDIVTLTKADIFIYLGAGMEPWVQSILQGINRPSLKVIEASQGLPAIKSGSAEAEAEAEEEEDEDEKGYRHSPDLHAQHDVADDGHQHESHQQHEGHDQHGDHQQDEGHDHHGDHQQHEGHDHHGDHQQHEGHDQHGDHQQDEGHDHHHGPMDPHCWLDFSYDQIMVSQIARAFSEQDPAGANVYRQNASQYQKKLAELDRKYQEGLKGCQNRKIFLGGHSAFGYLAKRYHLEQIPLYGISPDAEPSPKMLAEIVDMAKKLRIKTIFFEELVSDRLARVLADEVGAATLTLNPGANITTENVKSGATFLSLMEKNLDNLRKGLGCE